MSSRWRANRLRSRGWLFVFEIVRIGGDAACERKFRLPVKIPCSRRDIELFAFVAKHIDAWIEGYISAWNLPLDDRGDILHHPKFGAGNIVAPLRYALHLHRGNNRADGIGDIEVGAAVASTPVEMGRHAFERFQNHLPKDTAGPPARTITIRDAQRDRIKMVLHTICMQH